MPEYEMIFMKELHRKMKQKIVGKIYIRVIEDDKLSINITGYGGVIFNYCYENFSEQISHGLNTDYVMYTVIREYKKEVIKQYFY